MSSSACGYDGRDVTRVNGPVVEVSAADERLAMLELVYVGPRRLPGEVIMLANDTAHGAGVRVHRRPEARR